MKYLIDVLICLVKGHKWRPVWLDDNNGNQGYMYECDRCGTVFYEEY